MTDQEKINASVDNRLSNLETKFELFMQESQQQREDIRRLQERQDAIQAKHNAEMKSMQEKQDAKMHEMNQRFYEKVDANAKEFTNQLHSNFVQTMIGVGAIMAAIGGLIIATLK
ncbi:MAG: hypothetical protein IJG33_01545 [Selenomonadaceae bacterium]|nr:hypothetical protein [Selenomonadaceae bacterium]MBQ6005578.1 hypothetical protein [Selenomonadaceae bacterium]